jgi:hypothetical protein
MFSAPPASEPVKAGAQRRPEVERAATARKENNMKTRTRKALIAGAVLAGLALQARAQGGQMNMDVTLSDEAQRNTIAFDALGFLTGSLGADSFFPPGKVADFWGFQFLRDNDPTEMGHNTDFLTRAANNMLSVLTPAQRADLAALAAKQVDAINQYAADRFVLMNAFRRLLAADTPAGKPALDLAAVKAFSADLYRLDARMSLERAEVMGRIIRTLSSGQRAYLDGLKGKGMLTWPDLPDPIDKRDYSHDVHVAIMTYAGDIFSWSVGSLEGDVYFCPERQGTYFGSFYLKDAPAVGNADYSIDTTITANMGDALLDALNPVQSRLISDLVELQKSWLYELVDVRRQICAELRRAISGQALDSGLVLELAGRYGELDGEIIALYAARFAAVGRSLTLAQTAELNALRKKLIGDLAPAGAYLYAEPIPMPDIRNTDFLFGKAAKGALRWR